MESSFTFLRVRGIPIGANWSWLFVLALLVWTYATAFFPRTYPGLSDTAYLGMALSLALLFFASILLHELGHAFRALKEGMRIEGITLWLFGGVAKFSGMFPSAGAEFRVAIAGPLVSVCLALGFGALSLGAQAFGLPVAFRGVVDYLARTNAILVGFNLVPAFPLDGGRVLRAWLWHRQQNFAAATGSAAKAGRAFAVALIAIGLLGFFSGAGIGGLWFVILGWFLMQAAQSEAVVARMRTTFAGLRVRDIMTPGPVTVHPQMPLDDFVALAALSRHSSYPVVSDGRLHGLVSLRMASAGRAGGAHVADVMIPAPDVPTVDPTSEVLDVIDVLRGPIGRAVAVRDGVVVGVLSASDVARAIEVGEAFPPAFPPAEPAPRRAGAAVWIVVGAAIALAAAILYHPPLAVVAPGEALDVTDDITISGVPVHAPSGRYLLTSVSLGQPNAFMAAVAAVHPGQDVIALSSVFPRGVNPEEFLDQQRDLFEESRMVAAAAAARAAGMTVEVSGTGAHVISVVRGSPAAERLRGGDVIVAIDGRTINRVSDVRDVVRARPAGTAFTVTVERGGRRVDFGVTSARLDNAEGAAGLGVYIETRGFDVKLPFKVTFAEHDIGGPSAGLSYALAVSDLLDEADRARGRTIAATGTIDLDGRVGEVGGVAQKVVAARREGADLFLVPASEVDDARRSGMRVVGVTSLAESLEALRAMA